MNIDIVAVGKLRPFYRSAADEYIRRLRRYVQMREHEVREASKAPSPIAQRAEEAGRLGARISAGSTVVALTREGTGWSSRDLANQLERWLMSSRPIAFVLGGSHGLDPSFLARSEARWSLGPLTFPHELARVVVLEQLYRAFTILRGQPYHKGL
ncbi:MAG TPA: 23S rRNA (pseudouridine(1915)-N(3))-methyltransferase RlmH [Gemmatimonadales bacterium]|nr:23S rRNA (pseudouridine(1915)-N(3))-methyltransferase RlmH [Gemmatimonadales bacterium]